MSSFEIYSAPESRRLRGLEQRHNDWKDRPVRQDPDHKRYDTVTVFRGPNKAPIGDRNSRLSAWYKTHQPNEALRLVNRGSTECGVMRRADFTRTSTVIDVITDLVTFLRDAS